MGNIFSMFRSKFWVPDHGTSTEFTYTTWHEVFWTRCAAYRIQPQFSQLLFHSQSTLSTQMQYTVSFGFCRGWIRRWLRGSERVSYPLRWSVNSNRNGGRLHCFISWKTASIEIGPIAHTKPKRGFRYNTA